MERKLFVVGNWKLNKSVKETKEFLKEFKKRVSDVKDIDIGISPTFISLLSAKEELNTSNIKLFSQDAFYEDSGAFTGEVSSFYLKDIVDGSIIGHSERRKYFYDINELINKKIFSCIKNNLPVIMCVGETKVEREEKNTFKVVETQIKEGLKDINKEDFSKFITIAYEPVWAIGTGLTATKEEAEEVHGFIRDLLKRMYDEKVSENTRILYGGSVKPSNAKQLMSQANIDGVLVGGASLKVDLFTDIIKFK
jgi:triosephosphate isomerase (TIM)